MLYTLLRKCLLLSLLLVSACEKDRHAEIGLSGTTMGTTWSVIYVSGTAHDTATVIGARIQAALDAVDNMMSTYKSDSALSQFNNSTVRDWQAVPLELARVVSIAQDLSSLTQGAYDITVAPLVDLWGFGPAIPTLLPPDPNVLNAALAQVGYQNLSVSLEPPQLRKAQTDLHIDLSSIAKGFGVDQAAAALHAVGVHHFLLEVGGELYAAGNKADGTAWRVAVEHPAPQVQRPMNIILVSDIAVATSGDYRNGYIGRDGQWYSHTIDPRTGYPVRHQHVAVTVVADNATYADALSTALLALEPTAALALAEENALAVLLIVREEEDYKMLTSTAFQRLTAKPLN